MTDHVAGVAFSTPHTESGTVVGRLARAAVKEGIVRYQVSPADLSREVEDVGAALVDLDGVRVSVTLGALGPALAGSATTASLTRLCDSWDAAIRDTRSSLRSLGEGLAAALSGYEQIEALARQSFAERPSAATGGPANPARTGPYSASVVP